MWRKQLKIASTLLLTFSSSLLLAQNIQETELNNERLDKSAEESTQINTLQLDASTAAHPGYWASEVSRNPQDANAWYNYYKTQRYSYYSETSKKLSQGEQQSLSTIVADMEAQVPESYEYNYVKYWNEPYKTSTFKYLEKAYELSPNKAELYDDFIAWYEIYDDQDAKKNFCKKLDQSNTIPAAIMEYNYNVLMSLEANAVLITNGEHDTYPLWIWQQVRGVRPDVKVLNLDLLEFPSYQAQVKKEIGARTTATITSNKTAFLKQLASSTNQSRPVYFGMTVDPNVLKGIQRSLFLTGVALRYSPSNFDNISMLQRNWESKFKKAEVSERHGQSTLIRKLKMNYVLPLLLLGERYEQQGNLAKAREVQEIAYLIAKDAGQEKLVTDYLKR